MIKRCALLVVAAIPFVASVAVADGPSPNACSDAYTRAQILRNDRKLMQARDALRLCSQPTCKDFIVKDCTTWLDQVQTSLPTIVPIATDEAGNNLALVRLTMDGKALADKLDGRSFEVDPGSHSFTFETTDGTPRASQRLVVLVAEEEKNKRVAVALARPGVAATARSPASTPIGPTPSPPSAVALQTTPASTPVVSAPATPAPDALAGPAPATAVPLNSDHPPQSAPSNAWKVVGLTTASVGVVGLGVGIAFGAVASSKKGSAGCDSNSVCPNDTDANTLRDAKSAANLSTTFFVVGAILAAGGLGLWVLAPSGPVQVVPAVDHHEGGLAFRGLW
jgi:hypothetical protein